MAKIIANTKGMDRETWLELRKGGLGGSDCAAVAGVSKYSSLCGLNVLRSCV